MAKLKKYKVLRGVSYGTFAEKDARGAIIKTDVQRYEAGEPIELPADVAKGLLADGAIGEFDAKPKDEVPPDPMDDAKPESKVDEKKAGK